MIMTIRHHQINNMLKIGYTPVEVFSPQMKVRQKVQKGYMVKKIGLFVIRTVGFYKLIRTVDIALYQSIILLYGGIFIRDEKNLVNGLIGHQVLPGNFIFPDCSQY